MGILNGTPAPTLTLSWDEESQTVKVEFDKKVVRNWVYAKMLLTGALAMVEQCLAGSALQGALNGMAAQAQEQAVRNSLKLG